jgi:competence ComEA-like helix-hairpin-helix protein
MLVSESQRLGAITVVLVSLSVYGLLLFHARQTVPETPLPWGSQGPGLMALEVAGDPAKEGIYFVPQGATFATVRDIAEIPGMNGWKTIEDVRISAGSVLLTSPQGEAKIGAMVSSKKLALGLPIDLNLASEGELSLVPGIGEKMAYQIIQLRKQRGAFRNLSDLKAVPGIKGKKLNLLKDYLIVIEEP